MSVSDEYVWVYSETLFWWNSNGDKNVPHAYKAATRVAQTSEFMEFVPVGDPGNAADTRPVLFLGTNYYFGNVNYMFQIGKYEVTNAQYCAFLNAVAASDPHELYNINMGDPGYYYVETTPLVFRGGILQSGTDGSYTYSTIPGRAHLPVNWVSWRSAARFANWMHNGMQNDPATTEYGAYDASTFVGTGWDKEDQDAHFADAKYWIPTVNEWYKAAFYKGGSLNAGYWTYATQSDTVPGSGPFDVNPNQVNYRADNYDFGDGVDHGDLLSAGFYTASPGPYGTYDQNGNVYELLEEWSPGGYENNLRRRYGGAFWYNDSDQLSYGGMSYDWYGPYYETGFRLVYRGPQCLTPIPGDVYNDCKIDIMDISVLVEHWLDCNLIPQTACQD